MDNNNINDLIKIKNDNNWEQFKNNIFIEDNQDIPMIDDSLFDKDIFNEPDLD